MNKSVNENLSINQLNELFEKSESLIFKKESDNFEIKMEQECQNSCFFCLKKDQMIKSKVSNFLISTNQNNLILKSFDGELNYSNEKLPH